MKRRAFRLVFSTAYAACLLAAGRAGGTGTHERASAREHENDRTALSGERTEGEQVGQESRDSLPMVRMARVPPERRAIHGAYKTVVPPTETYAKANAAISGGYRSFHVSHLDAEKHGGVSEGGTGLVLSIEPTVLLPDRASPEAGGVAISGSFHNYGDYFRFSSRSVGWREGLPQANIDLVTKIGAKAARAYFLGTANHLWGGTDADADGYADEGPGYQLEAFHWLAEQMGIEHLSVTARYDFPSDYRDMDYDRSAGAREAAAKYFIPMLAYVRDHDLNRIKSFSPHNEALVPYGAHYLHAPHWIEFLNGVSAACRAAGLDEIAYINNVQRYPGGASERNGTDYDGSGGNGPEVVRLHPIRGCLGFTDYMSFHSYDAGHEQWPAHDGYPAGEAVHRYLCSDIVLARAAAAANNFWQARAFVDRLRPADAPASWNMGIFEEEYGRNLRVEGNADRTHLNGRHVANLHKLVRMIYMARMPFLRGACLWTLGMKQEVYQRPGQPEPVRQYSPGFGLIPMFDYDKTSQAYWTVRLFNEHCGTLRPSVKGRCPYFSSPVDSDVNARLHSPKANELSVPYLPALVTLNEEQSELYIIVVNGDDGDRSACGDGLGVGARNVQITVAGRRVGTVAAVKLETEDPAHDGPIIPNLTGAGYRDDFTAAVTSTGGVLSWTQPPLSAVFVRAALH